MCDRTEQAVPTPKSGIERRRRAAKADGPEGYHERRRELVRIAALVFREKGFAAATLNDIAARLGTERASIYYYVANKEELLQEIIRDMMNENVMTAERVHRKSGTGAQKLEELIEDMVVSFDRNYPHMYVYVEDSGRLSRHKAKWAKDILAAGKQFEEIVISILEEGQRDGSLRADLSADLAALTLFGMVNWTHRWYKPGSTYNPREIARTMSGIFLSGMHRATMSNEDYARSNRFRASRPSL